MGICTQCEQQTVKDYNFAQDINLEKQQLPANLDEFNQNRTKLTTQQPKIKTFSRITTATTSSQEPQEFNNKLANSQVQAEKQTETNIRPKYKQRSQLQNYKNYQQKISEEAESMLSQFEEKIIKKNSSQQNQKLDSDLDLQESSRNSKIEQTIINLLQKMDNAEKQDILENMLNPQINPITEMNSQDNQNDQSISEIPQNIEHHDIDYSLGLQNSLESELEEENNLNKAFVYYSQSNNLNLSNICNALNKDLVNVRLTYNTVALQQQFQRQISSISKLNQSTPFLAEYSGISQNSKKDQILINRMPTSIANQLQKRINYVKINYN